MATKGRTKQKPFPEIKEKNQEIASMWLRTGRNLLSRELSVQIIEK